jgi:hypothetical protein
MAFFGTDEHELFLSALGIEEQVEIDSLSTLYLPAFGSPIYASISFSDPCEVKLYIPMDRWDSEKALNKFKHFWTGEGCLSHELSSEISRDFYRLKSLDFVDYCDFNVRDGFAVYCKGVFKGQPFRFFSQNPGLKTRKNHIAYLLLIRKALRKLFPNIVAIESMNKNFLRSS